MDERIQFRDRSTGKQIFVGLSLQNGLSFRIEQKPARVVRELEYHCPSFGVSRVELNGVGHVLSSPSLPTALSLPFEEANDILRKLYKVAEFANITHNLPAAVSRTRSMGVRMPHPPQREERRQVRPFTASVVGVQTNVSSPRENSPPQSPPSQPAAPESAAQSGPDASEHPCVPDTSRRRHVVIEIDGKKHDENSLLSPLTTAPAKARLKLIRPRTPLRVQDITAETLPLNQDRNHTSQGRTTTSPTAPTAFSETSWVWEQLRQRETSIQVLKIDASETSKKVKEMEKQVQISDEKYVEQVALVERMRIGGTALPAAPEGKEKVSSSARVDTNNKGQSALRKKELQTWAAKGQNSLQNGGSTSPRAKPMDNMAAEESLNKALRRIQSIEGDASATLVGLDAIKKCVGLSILNRELKKWASSHKGEKGIGLGQSGLKYGDGVAEARAPDQTEKLEFYPEDFKPERSVRQTVEDIASWRGPLGCFWPQVTFVDLIGSLSLIEHHHSARQPPVLVLPFYTYSLSLFRRVVWVTWCAVKGTKPFWEVLMAQAEHLERAFSEMDGDNLEIDTSLFKNIRALSQLTEDKFKLIPRHSSVFDIDVFRTEKHVLIRYDNTKRGDGNISPLHETVLWLPPLKLSVNTLFAKPLDHIPPPGVIEYLFSRPSSEKLTWAEHWSCKRAVGPEVVSLIKKCLNVVDQQKVDFTITQSLRSLLESESGLMGPQKKKDTHLLDSLKLIIQTKLAASDETGKGAGYTPQAVAHALDIQKVVYQNKSFCASLAGSPCLIAEVRSRPDCIELTRLKHGFDDQIYWHINAAMRNYQFQNIHPTVRIQDIRLSSQDLSGTYVLKDNPPTAEESLKYMNEPNTTKKHSFVRDAPPFRRAVYSTKRQNWDVSTTGGHAGTVKSSEVTPMNLGTWMLLQVQPFCFFLDRALELLRRVDRTQLPHEVIPPRAGVKNYRGLAGVVLDRRVYDLNKIVLWGQFSSSSIDRGVASAFAKGAETAAVFTLIGKSCVCIAQWSRFAREHEWLYPPNSIFKVTNCLAEEHQMILDKANLQLFSMEEVDEFAAIETYLRGLVPCITGDDAPMHVMQLFNIIHHLVRRMPEDALMCLLSPFEKAMYTAEGLRVANRLLLLNKKHLKENFESPPPPAPTTTTTSPTTPFAPMTPISPKKVDHLQAVDINLLKAAEIGSEEALEILIDLGGNIETTVGGHLTPLQLAAVGGHYHAVKKLIKIGANLEASGGGFTGVELAALRRDHQLTELLRENCPNLSNVVPQRLEEYQPRVLLPPMGQLRKSIEKVPGLKWDRTRAKHSEKKATVVLFDRERNLFWLRFEDDSTDLYPADVLIKPTEAMGHISAADELARRRSTKLDKDELPTGSPSRRSSRHSFTLRVPIKKQRGSTASTTAPVARPPANTTKRKSAYKLPSG